MSARNIAIFAVWMSLPVAMACAGGTADARNARPYIAVLSGGWAGRDAAISDALRKSLASAGMNARTIGPGDLADESVLTPARVAMLVIPDAATFPGPALHTLQTYLDHGGNLICLGAPAFDRIVRRMDGQWLDERQLSDKLRSTPSTHSLLTLVAGGESAWQRATNDTTATATWRIGVGADGGGPALHHTIADLTGWDTLTATLEAPPEPGENLILFRAKGGPLTTALAVEMREKDESRWIATVPLRTTWQRYAVPSSEFKLWDPDHTSGRGGPGDGFHPENTRIIAVGLAFTHTHVTSGRHEYWFADLGSANGPTWPRYEQPVLDTLSPVYKLYPIRGAASIDDTDGRALVGPTHLPLPAHLLSTHPRPTGGGFDKGRKYRWIPLLQVVGKQGVAGTVATLMAHAPGSGQGVWVSLTAVDPEWYRLPSVRTYVARLAKRFLDKPLLFEGGSQYFGYYPDETVTLGARAVGRSADTVRFAVTPVGGTKAVFAASVPLRGAKPGEQVTRTWNPHGFPHSRYTVTTQLVRNGAPIDELRHEITVRRPKAHPRFMTTAHGMFLQNGQPWSPHGVNYMPSSGVAAEDGPYFEQWLSAQSYDPRVVERDLTRIQAIGFNMISAFIYTTYMHSHNLADLLNRCDAHGIKVNLSLRPGTPLDFEWPGVGNIVKANRLANDDTVFAYDLAWEPSWGGYAQRKRWDPDWERWLVAKYGSVERAEEALGEQVPRTDGKVTSLRDNEVMGSSPIPRLAAAYRHFQDDLLDRTHSEARRKIRTVDPHHLLSFRMSIGGDPTCNPAAMPYDFKGLAHSMDFMSPEGYGRIGGWEQVKPGWFTSAYSHMVAPGKPVMWAEFGYTLWDPASADASKPSSDFATAFERRFYPPATVTYTESYYRFFYDMILKSGAAGSVCWWYPGGFRYGENSDFGIIDPDGTWRGLTRIIHAYAPKITGRKSIPQPNAWIDVNRDAHPDGIYGMYAKVREQFWSLIAQGKVPGLRTKERE